MRRVASGIGALVLVLFALAAPALYPAPAAATETDAARFVGTLANRALERLTASDLSDAERESRMKEILDSSFDMPAIARFVLGIYWPRASAQQQEEFFRLYEQLVVRNYAALFRQYTGESLTVGDVRKIEESESYIVLSQIEKPDGKPPIPVEWRVRQSQPNAFKVVDVKVEGVSMPVTHRNEYASVIRRQGGRVDDLLAVLRNRLGEPSSSQAGHNR